MRDPGPGTVTPLHGGGCARLGTVRPIALFAIVAALTQEPGSPLALELAVRDGAVTIRARAVALKEILDRLASATGMKVVYDGSPPLAPVTISIENVPPPAAVLHLMEGLGVSYAFNEDPEGERIRTLMLFDRSVGLGQAPSPQSEAGAALPQDEPAGVEADADPQAPGESTPARPNIPNIVSLPPSYRPSIPSAVSLPLPSRPGIPDAVSLPRR